MTTTVHRLLRDVLRSRRRQRENDTQLRQLQRLLREIEDQRTSQQLVDLKSTDSGS